MGFVLFWGFWGWLFLVGFVLFCSFFPASVQYISHVAFFHVKSVFPIQMPKASRTSVQGCKDPPVAAQPKAFGLSMRPWVGGARRACFHFDFCRGVLEQQSTGVTAV